MKSDANKLTTVGIGMFILLVIAGALGFCGKPSDHQPKPNPSSSVKSEQKKNPVPQVSTSKVRR